MSKKYIEDYHHGQYRAPKPGDKNYDLKMRLGHALKQMRDRYFQKMNMHQSSGGFYVGKSKGRYGELEAAHKDLRDRRYRTGEYKALKPWWEEE